MPSKTAITVLSLVAVLIVGGIVYVTFQPDLQRSVTQLVPSLAQQSSSNPLPLASLAPDSTVIDLYSLVGSGRDTNQGYVLPANNDQNKIYIRGAVENWSGSTLNVQINDIRGVISVPDPTKVICQPENLTDESGNPIKSSDVYIDLTNFTGTLTPQSLSLVRPQFAPGAPIALTADKQGEGWQADILVGFGCSL